jgi:hypothetical protein
MLRNVLVQYIVFFCPVCSIQCMCLFQAFVIRQQYW